MRFRRLQRFNRKRTTEKVMKKAKVNRTFVYNYQLEFWKFYCRNRYYFGEIQLGEIPQESTTIISVSYAFEQFIM